ncbi:MAG TPA: hypothetical protein VMZ49_12975 [Patescibacteria group bacterium]|nr:hypothetical protein [Patescibacteria group bacterium]
MKRLLVIIALAAVIAAVAFTVFRSKPAPGPARASDTEAVPPRASVANEVSAAAVPLIALRINGLAAGPGGFVLEQGEPVIAEVQLRHPDRRDGEVIRLEPPSGSWAGRVRIRVTGADGRAAAWLFSITGKPSSGGLGLKPGCLTTLVLRLEPEARAAMAQGAYRVSARLDLEDGLGFRGAIETPALDVVVVMRSREPLWVVLGKRQLLRVRDALLGGDVAGAEAAAREMQRLGPQRPEGFIGMALVHEARGERGPAILAAETALSRTKAGDSGETEPMDGSVQQSRSDPQGPLKEAPLEYYELLDRLRRMPQGAPKEIE